MEAVKAELDHQDLTTAQYGVALGVAILVAVWMNAELSALFQRKKDVKSSTNELAQDMESIQASSPMKNANSGGDIVPDAFKSTSSIDWTQMTFYAKVFRLEKQALIQSLPTLRAMLEFSGIMIWYFICDRTTMFPSQTKHYSRDLFGLLYGILVFVSFCTSLEKNPPQNSGYLNRDLTEEWKGWMQVLFLMYHYFNAAEMYNSIRLYIAAYVWMTGFGNFSYYYIRRDFSVGRFCQMMWRLNFLVFWVCIFLGNSWMLYYICPMHTLFTVLVYVTLAVNNKMNQESNSFVLLKIFGITLVTIAMWEIPGVFSTLWKPFSPLVQYIDPKRPDVPPLWEWQFRSGLDRYIWIIGMLFAFCHPPVERLIQRIDEMPLPKKVLIRTVAIAGVTGVMIMYTLNIFFLPKVVYNKFHPFTSFIPITSYIILRNISPTLRGYHLRLFSQLGKVTLETYICQFHIWMRTGGPDAQPKLLLSLMPLDYPLINFGVCTMVFVGISYRLFHLTNQLRVAMIPSNNNKLLATNLCFWSGFLTLLYILGCAIKMMYKPA